MIEFRKVGLDARDDILQYTLVSDERNCDFSFANLCSWAFLYHTEYAIKDDFLLLRFYIDGKLVYMVLAGGGDLAAVLSLLQEDTSRLKEEFRILGISQQMRERMEQTMPGQWVFDSDRNCFDYLYLRTDLSTLKGKRFQAKRNHVNHFRKQYPNYEYKPLAMGLIQECMQLEEEWYLENGCNGQKDLLAERQSMQYVLEHQKELGVTGGVLEVDGRIVAFTCGAPINQDTWGICVEKANAEIEGAYAMINFEYANQIEEKYVYINREEDLGLEGLRKAKLSYQPYCLLEKYSATYDYEGRSKKLMETLF